MKRMILILGALALLTAGGFGAYYYLNVCQANSGERFSSDSEDAVYAEKVSVITGNGINTRYGGTAVAQATLEVSLDSERVLKECYVKKGQKIKKNDPLFSYDTQEQEDKIAQDELDIEKDKMNIETTHSQISEQEKLRESAENDKDREEARLAVLSCENEIASYEYEIEKTELEIENLKETVENSTVTAEMGGMIQNISNPNQEENRYSEEESAYITILAEGDLRIEASIDELAYDRISEGTDMLVYSRTNKDGVWHGKVTEISGEKDKDNEDSYYYYGSSDSSTYTFYVELNDENDLLLGEHVYLEIDDGQAEAKEGMWLPEGYVMKEDGSTYVWLASKSNKIEKHEIVCGEYDEETLAYEVLDSLAMNDYIAYPSDEIEEGSPVRYSDIAVSSDDESYGIADDYYDNEDWNDDDWDGEDEWSDEDNWNDDDWDDEDLDEEDFE